MKVLNEDFQILNDDYIFLLKEDLHLKGQTEKYSENRQSLEDRRRVLADSFKQYITDLERGMEEQRKCESDTESQMEEVKQNIQSSKTELEKLTEICREKRDLYEVSRSEC